MPGWRNWPKPGTDRVGHHSTPGFMPGVTFLLQLVPEGTGLGYVAPAAFENTDRRR